MCGTQKSEPEFAGRSSISRWREELRRSKHRPRLSVGVGAGIHDVPFRTAKRCSNAHAADRGTPVAKTKGTQCANLKDVDGAGVRFSTRVAGLALARSMMVQGPSWPSLFRAATRSSYLRAFR